jgi:hypothetical protein
MAAKAGMVTVTAAAALGFASSFMKVHKSVKHIRISFPYDTS